MTTFKHVKSFLLPAIMAVMVLGCSTTGVIPKSEALLATELFYQKTSDNPKVRKHAASELKKARKTLKSAVKAETPPEMAHWVYIGNNQINTAIEVAEINAAKSRMHEIKALRSKLGKRSFLELKKKHPVAPPDF